MSDLGSRAFDLAAERAEQEREAGVARLTAGLQQAGSDECIDCGNPIGAARRAAMPSAGRCIACQTLQERRK